MTPQPRRGRGDAPRSRPVLPAGTVQRALLEGTGMSVPLAQLLSPRHLILDSWTNERTFHRPGAGVSCLYAVQALDRAGRTLTLYAGATTAPTPTQGEPLPGTLQTTVAGTALTLWLHPYDPMLPALPWSLSAPDIARDIFAGMAGAGGRPELSLSAYRPLRRAVVRATSGGVTAYLKIVLPGQTEELRRRHSLLAGTAVPAAAVIGPGSPANPSNPSDPSDHRTRGAVVLSALEGEPLLQGLHTGSHGLTPEDLTRLLDLFPDQALSLKPRPAWAERARAYGSAAAAILPDEGPRITAMARAIEQLVRTLDPGPVVPVHGDFYEGNLLAAGGRITGVLDVDAMGPGHRVDDLACFIGHLAVQAELSPGSALPGELQRFRTAFEHSAEAAGSSRAALNARAAGVALSLVAGARTGKLSRTNNALARLGAAGKLLAQAEAEVPGKPM